MGLRGCGVFSLVFSLPLVCGGVMGACLWPHIAQFYFPAIATGTLMLINGILVVKISDAKNQFLSEISVVLSVSLLSIPAIIYSMCCQVTNTIEFIGHVVDRDLSQPLRYLIKETELQEHQTMTRSPTLAMAIIDVTLMTVLLLIFVTCIITVISLRVLLMDRETDRMLNGSWFMAYRNEGEREHFQGVENPAYGCSNTGYSPQENRAQLPRTDPTDFHREPPRIKKRQTFPDPHVTWSPYPEDSLYM